MIPAQAKDLRLQEDARQGHHRIPPSWKKARLSLLRSGGLNLRFTPSDSTRESRMTVPLRSRTVPAVADAARASARAGE